MAESLPGPSVEKKRKSSGGTRFKFNWTLPVQKSIKLIAYCKLCLSHFNISRGGINHIKHHCEGKGHSERLEYQQSIMMKLWIQQVHTKLIR